MVLSDCSKCKYFDHQPNHRRDVVCGVDPAYASMWSSLKPLDEYTKSSIPVDNCQDFQIEPDLEVREVTLNLSFRHWLEIANHSSNTQLLEQLHSHLRSSQFTLCLSLKDSKQLFKEQYSNSQLVSQLTQQGIELNLNTFNWLEVDSSCIKAIAFNSSSSILQIRFNSGSVYQYHHVRHDVFESFCNASSKGRFFHRNIKDVYDYELL